MSIRSIERAMLVLQEMNLQPYTSIAHLHARTGLPKATLVRILQTFEGLGYVENDSRLGGYQVSALVGSLSSGFHKEPMVVEAGRAWAVAITRKYQWPVSISLLDHDAVVVRFSTVPDSSVSPMRASPEVAESRPAMQCMRVDLPDPEGPMMAVNSPRPNSTSTASRAVTAVSPSPYRLVRPVARAAGSGLRGVFAAPRSSGSGIVGLPCVRPCRRSVVDRGCVHPIMSGVGAACPSCRRRRVRARIGGCGTRAAPP